MTTNRIDSLSTSSEGPRQTPHQEFGVTLQRTLAQGGGTVLGLASPLAGAINPALSAAVSRGAQIISSFAQSSQVPGGVPLSTGGIAGTAGTPSVGAGAAGTTGASGSASDDPMALAAGDDPAALLKAQATMSEQNNAFNVQYLGLQEQLQQESRQFQALSNIMKVRHDSAKAAINNIH